MIFLDIETVPDEAAISSRQWAEHKAKKGCDDAEVERLMNTLVAAGSGQPLPHETLLPFEVRSAGPVMPAAIRAALMKEQGR